MHADGTYEPLPPARAASRRLHTLGGETASASTVRLRLYLEAPSIATVSRHAVDPAGASLLTKFSTRPDPISTRHSARSLSPGVT